jgi:actin-like ATPase involved in cell morphogenesis
MVDSESKIFNAHSDKTFERRRTESPQKKVIDEPVDMGNAYKHSVRPANINRKISEREVVNMSSDDGKKKIAAEPDVRPSSGPGKAVGIDVGTAFIVSARYNEAQQIDTVSARDGFFKMDATKQKKNMLDSSNVKYVKMGEELFVVGNEAFDMAVLFDQTLRRPLKDGVLSAEEKECEPVIMEILKAVAGKGSLSDVVYYSIPADPVDSDFDIIYHEAKISHFLEKLGFKIDNVFSLNEGMAIVNSELADTMFTGLAISFGAGMTNVAMSYRGLEIFSFSIARGGDWIDSEVARNRKISLSDAAATKEADSFDLMDPKDVVEDAIRIFYSAHLNYVIRHIMGNLELHKRKIKLRESLKVVVSGGTSKPKNFIKLFEEQVEKKPWNIPVGEVVQASNPLDAVARGCLIAAQRDVLDR